MTKRIRSDGLVFVSVTLHIEESLKAGAQESGLNMTGIFREALENKLYGRVQAAAMDAPRPAPKPHKQRYGA
ncbi:hypothetical protein J2T61_000531 [Methanocalculus sp. AMF5]|nr:hypothetical protein [Methanocalculus sp. AMF5]